MTKMILGVDEAGRGPVLGPMVMVACAVPETKEQELARIGCKDSKVLSPKQREDLYDLIYGLCDVAVGVVTPREIDEAVSSKTDNLNHLESRTTASLLNELAEKHAVKHAVIDCPSSNPESYERELRKQLKKDIKLLCEYKADANHPVVSAASIIAKVTRDKEVARISEMIGEPVGSGYPSDETTQEWLRKNYKRSYGFIRRSWAPVKNLEEGRQQRHLFEFSDKHKAEVTKFDKLLAFGFTYEEPKTKYEVLRMRGPEHAEATIIKYSTGKLLVQGSADAQKKAHALLQTAGIE